jgi:hypothetical protein
MSISPFRSYFGPRPILWFSWSRRLSWSLTLSDPIFLPSAYSPALIYFGRERGWWVTCNYPTVLKEQNINRKSTTCAICWLKSIIPKEKRREQENHNVGRSSQYGFYIGLWVRLCSISYPANKTHAPYRHLWSAWLYHIFPHYLINGKIFEKGYGT